MGEREEKNFKVEDKKLTEDELDKVSGGTDLLEHTVEKLDVPYSPAAAMGEIAPTITLNPKKG